MILSLKKSASNFNVFHNFKYPVLLLFLRKNIICYLDEIKKKKKIHTQTSCWSFQISPLLNPKIQSLPKKDKIYKENSLF